MTEQQQSKVKELRERADRLVKSVSSGAGPSSQVYVSPERFDHIMRKAQEARDEADRIEKGEGDETR